MKRTTPTTFISGSEQKPNNLPLLNVMNLSNALKKNLEGTKMRKTVAPRAKEEFTTDPVGVREVGAIKYDGGKPSAFRGTFDYFPRALEQVATVSTFGAAKYAWRGWEAVPEGFERYSDAMVRHLIQEGKGEALDSDSGLLHAAHTAWGALARLELLLREKENATDA